MSWPIEHSSLSATYNLYHYGHPQQQKIDVCFEWEWIGERIRKNCNLTNFQHVKKYIQFYDRLTPNDVIDHWRVDERERVIARYDENKLDGVDHLRFFEYFRITLLRLETFNKLYFNINTKIIFFRNQLQPNRYLNKFYKLLFFSFSI